ncbi:MAG: PHB depolymerase family esterase [Acidimicrobiales bacterium]
MSRVDLRRRPSGITLFAATLAAALLAAAVGCTGSDRASPTPSTDAAASTTASTVPTPASSVSAAVPVTRQVIGPEERRAELVVPDGVDGSTAPLLLVLHGYAFGPHDVDRLFGAVEQASARRLFVLLPTGSTDLEGRKFWNASPACCNYSDLPVDDVSYLRGLLDEVVATWPVDRDRIYVLGHSNGGFMAYRLACDAPEVSAVAVVAAADALEDGGCQPDKPISVLHVHGTADRKVPYDGGGDLLAPTAGAVETVSRWARRDGCADVVTSLPPIDLDTAVPGAETAVASHQGCPPGIAVQLDTMEGSEHIPTFDHDSVGRNVIDWLLGQQAAAG